MRDIPPLTVPARFAGYLHLKVARMVADIADGKWDTVHPAMLDPDGPDITITFSDDSPAIPTLCSEAA